MIITLTIITLLISALHYLGLEGFAIWVVSEPLISISITGTLMLIKGLIWLYRFIPTFRRMFRRTENFLNRYENSDSRVGGKDKTNPFTNGSKRKFSTRVKPLAKSGGVGNKNRFTPKTSPSLLETIRSKFRVASKVVPLSQVFLRTSKFKNMLRQMYYLTLARTRRLAFRANCTTKFLSFILKLKKNHGPEFTIKWLKAGYVSIQKELGQNGLKSLRDLNPDLPLPCLAGRLPRIIPVQDRASIKAGNVAIIRFWSSLFNLYRIFKCAGDIKLSTITAPFSGSEEGLRFLESRVNNVNPFRSLKIFKDLASCNLSPTNFEISRAASPSASTAITGILTDIYEMYNNREDLYNALHHMAYATHPEQTAFMQKIADGYDIISDLKAYDGQTIIGKDGVEYFQINCLMTKSSVRAHGYAGLDQRFAQFAIKEEAAGKVRVFALLDSLSQTFLRPLHDELFEILKEIPNDGTFNQDASVIRCQEKAMEFGSAYSFDLTAATDRIPASLSAKIIEALFSNDLLGQYWHKVMTDREFYLNPNVAEKYKVSPGPYRYAVGQPMGGLSSWAMLALTHHWIVQYAAFLAGTNTNFTWYTAYEILGDDLVIFDRLTADKYLEIMKTIGCEINLNKSIVSHNRPVFEFAKRTCWGTEIVSGISFNQLGADLTVGSRVANVLSFAPQGLISSSSILLSLLTRNALARVKSLSEKVTSVSLLALLGSLYQQGKVSLKELVTALIHPEDGLSGDIIDIPRAAVLKLAYTRLTDNAEVDTSKPVWPKMANRVDVFEEHEAFFTVQVLNNSLAVAESNLAKWKDWVRESSYLLFYPLAPDVQKMGEEAANAAFPGSIEVILNKDGSKTNMIKINREKIRLHDYLHLLPYKYVNLVDRLHEWTGELLGIGTTILDPAEMVELATDTLVQFQYDHLLTLKEALELQTVVEGFRDQVDLAVKPEPKEFIETAQGIELVKALVGINQLKITKSLMA
jgi:hypothetical protein